MLKKLSGKLRLLNERPYLKKVFKNTGWFYFDKFSRLLVSLFVGIFIVRYLGPVSFGEFSFATAIIGLISPIATLGLDSIMTREFVKYPQKRGVYLGTAMGIKVISSILCILGLVVFLNVLNTSMLVILMALIYSLTLVFDSSLSIAQLFDSDLRSKLSILVGQIALFATTILQIILLLIGAPVVFFILASLANSILSAILLWYLLRKHYAEIKVSFSSSTGKKLLSSSFPFMIAAFGTTIYMSADQVVVGYMLPVAAVGFYAVTIKLSAFFYFIPAAISSSVFPRIVMLGKENSPHYHARLQDFFDLMTMLGVIILVPFSFLSYYIITIIYGASYAAAAPILSVYVLSGIFVFFGFAANNHLIAKDYGKITLYRSVLGAVLNIILSIVFVYLFGLIGAAYATLVCFAFTFWASLYLFKETRFLFFMFLKSFNFARTIPMIVKKVIGN
jgi:O-antigen/teichoic acid export membrane protein